MSQFYKVLKADPLGEPWTPNAPDAKPIQNFWCQLEGVDRDVSIGKQVPNMPTPGEQIYGDLMYAKSQKGTEYWKFKSAKVPDGVQRPASTPAQAQAQQATGVNISEQMPGWFHPVYSMIEYVYKEMKKMDDNEDKVEVPSAPAPTEVEPNAKPIDGTPLDEVTKATLDNIFPPTEEAE